MPDAVPSVTIVEVGPRDGLQNHPRDISTAAKIGFIDALSTAGPRVIETTSFVNPKAVPKMADAAEVMDGIQRRPGVRYMALVPNVRGLERALAAGVDAIGLFAAATEEFSRANLNASIDETFVRFAETAQLAKANDVWVRGYISVAFHCPYSGAVAPERVLPVLERLVELGCDEFSLADTTGHATPGDVTALVTAALDVAPVEQLGLHLHDTRGMAIDNVAAGYDAGVTIFDGSSGGIGGCPFSPGAPGNVATESVVDFFERQGIATGIDSSAIRLAYDTWIA
ncbi:MAG: hydroxymethylglutaryl-CoA lyase [Thermomicrobiales bacterium]|nr:hydroxymethylglutaryl-CoA lyase [Thermomicrobiales bacterium]